MMRKYLLVVAAIVAFLGLETALAGPVAAVLARHDQIQVRVGVRPSDGRAELGGFGLWHEDGDTIGGGAYVTLDLLHEEELNFLGLTAPATWYIGAMAGVTDHDEIDKDDEVDVIASVLTGFTIGDKTIRIGPEYQFVFDESSWSELPPIDDQHQVFLNLIVRF
jgi:hypothetical protein